MNTRYFISFLLLAAVILYLSCTPSMGVVGPTELLNQLVRKSGHVVLFGGLTCLLWWSLPGWDQRFRMKIGVFLVVLLGFAALTEGLQTFVPERSGNHVGFSFDALGVLVVMGIFVRKGRYV